MNYKGIIEQMTLEEKAALLGGKSEWESHDIQRLNIPSMILSDGPHGVRKQDGAGDHLGLNPSLPATCFPTAATVANSWDVDLAQQVGSALGEEANDLGVNVLLGPGLNIKRNPCCGRNFEYFSEDPYLSGKMAAGYVRGIQAHNVSSCLKHFAVNSQETKRMVTNSIVDERALREIYLTGFEIAIKEAHPKTIMSSYNKVNDQYANENTHLLRDILRNEWGYEGVVVTDWGGSNDHVNGVIASSDLEMPNPGYDSARVLVAAVKSGRLQESQIDECVDRLLTLVFSTKVQGKQQSEKWKNTHHEIAKKAAAESTVLLKNENNILPLNLNAKVALIGDFAFEPRYQGAGSSLVNSTRVDKMIDSMNIYGLEIVGVNKGYQRDGSTDNDLLQEAVKIAGLADVVIYCFGLTEMSESEGMDRLNIKIPENQVTLLKKISEVNPNIVGVLSGGAAIETDWIDCCKGLLHGYLTGQAGSEAMWQLIMGIKNPSGKLAETYPVQYDDVPCASTYLKTDKNIEYRESIYVGYRYYETAQKTVRFPFGYGLSYSDFLYSDLQIDKNKGVSFVITNQSERIGAEIAQLYVGLRDSIVFRPVKELKGFVKVQLGPKESKKVEISFDDKTFRYFNVQTNSWEIEQGNYDIMIGSNIRDIRLQGNCEVDGSQLEPYNSDILHQYYQGDVSKISKEKFETLLGKKIDEEKTTGDLGINDPLCQMKYAKSALARLIFKIMNNIKIKSEKKATPDLNILFLYNMPFRAMAKMSGGMVSMEMSEGIVDIVNGHFFKGINRIIKGYFENKRLNKEFGKFFEK